MSVREGSFALSFSTTRARWKPWLIQGFEPRTSNSSDARALASKSIPSLPKTWPLTQYFCVNSCASALKCQGEPISSSRPLA